MEAKIINKTKETLIIQWSDNNIGYGVLSVNWDQELGKYVLDSEYTSLDTVLKIIKSLK